MVSLLGMAASYAAGILLGRVAPSLPRAAVLVALAASAALFAALFSRSRNAVSVFLSIAIATLGVLHIDQSKRSFADLYRRAPFLGEVTGTVVSYPNSEPGRTAFQLAPDNLPARLQVTIFWDDGGARTVLYGDRLRLRGSIKAPPRFPDFDYRAYLAEQGVFAVMTTDGAEGVASQGEAGNSLLRVGNLLRDRLLRRLDSGLSADNSALAHSLLFGETAGLSEEVSEAFRRTGLSHILAISGMNLAVLLAGLWFVLRLFGLRPAVAYPLVGASVLAILWLVGLPVSLVRAAIMFGFLAFGSVLADLGLILRRSIRLSHGLAAAALVILAVRPTALFDVGFQLSFGATAAILAWASLSVHPVSPPRNPSLVRRTLRKASRYGTDLVAVSLAAQAGTAPFLAWHFGMLYPLGLLANLLVVPLASLALWLGVLTVFVSATPLFAPFALAFGGLLRAMTWSVEILAHLPLAAVGVDARFGIVSAAVSLYAFAALYVVRGPRGLDGTTPRR